MERLLKSYEAAKLLAVSESTLNKLANAGKIKFIKIGERNRRYEPEEIQKFKERERS